MNVLIELGIFAAELMLVLIFILSLLSGILSLVSKNKSQQQGKIIIKNLNEKFDDIKLEMQKIILNKSDFKKILKKSKKSKKEKSAQKTRLFMLTFRGDIKASDVSALREEISAILGIADTTDEVVVRLESPGGLVHAYGLAASQLARLRERGIPLTVCVDKVAASGGYLMACVANKILAAPFAMIGSIGVVMQLPNFHRLLKKNNIDFEQITAGQYKRTLSLFGENTIEGREKTQEDINDIHTVFKTHITTYRPRVDVEQFATGEIWVGTQALEHRLIDELSTSDDYLLKASEKSEVYEIKYHTKKRFSEKASSLLSAAWQTYIS